MEYFRERQIDYKCGMVMGEWFKNEHDPDIFATLTLKQAIPGPNGCLIYGTEKIYRDEARKLVRDLSIKLKGKTSFKRTKELIPCLSTLEGTRQGARMHIHMCFKMPSNQTFQKTQETLDFLWRKSLWSRDKTDIDIIYGDAVKYILKNGFSAVLI